MPGNPLTAHGLHLPSDTQVGGVRLQVSDLARSIQYYERVLGLRVLQRGSAEASLGDHVGDVPIIELVELRGANPVRRRGHLGLFHFAILLPERAALGRLVRHLASLDVQIGASDHLVSEALYLHDPDGLGIEVYADRPRSAWAWHEGELVIDTLPLDIEGLVASAGNTEWTGMPEGTVMGHLHLHVGNLDAAAAFYRNALGFDVTVSRYPGALFLSVGGYHHHLGVNTWAGEDAPRPGDGDARLLAWELVLPDEDDVARTAGRLKAAGYGVVRTGGGAQVQDPWGTTLLLRN